MKPVICYHVPGELHEGSSQQEGVVDLLPVQIREDRGQAGADIMHHHVLRRQGSAAAVAYLKLDFIH